MPEAGPRWGTPSGSGGRGTGSCIGPRTRRLSPTRERDVAGWRVRAVGESLVEQALRGGRDAWVRAMGEVATAWAGKVASGVGLTDACRPGRSGAGRGRASFRRRSTFVAKRGRISAKGASSAGVRRGTQGSFMRSPPWREGGGMSSCRRSTGDSGRRRCPSDASVGSSTLDDRGRPRAHGAEHR